MPTALEPALFDQVEEGLKNVIDPELGVNTMRGPGLGVLIITHYTRILRYITPDVVHVMFEGRIARTGGPELADYLEENGYVEFGVAEEAAAPTVS
jgi:Fe-S cluster assembly ATP-binding protein